jgi:hypothetical protein
MVPEGKGGPRVAHGGDTRDGMRQMDGLTMGNLSCGYSCTTLNANDAQTEELSYEIGAVSADVAIGGVRVNIIPKEGGNTFSGSAFGNFSNSGLQGDNLSRELLDLGLRTPDVVDSIWDSSVELGGPLVRDRLWFHGAYRNWGLKLLPANTFYDRDPADYVFEPDESRPGVDEQYDQSASLRLTWQATDQNKLRSTTTARRGTARIRGSWQDLNGDFFPDENELGPYSNANFGWSVITNFFADDVTSGFGARRNNWEYSLRDRAGEPAPDVPGRGVLAARAGQLLGDRQRAGGTGGLRRVLRHRADGPAAAGGRRQRDLRAVRRESRQVRPGAERDHPGRPERLHDGAGVRRARRNRQLAGQPAGVSPGSQSRPWALPVIWCRQENRHTCYGRRPSVKRGSPR